MSSWIGLGGGAGATGGAGALIQEGTGMNIGGGSLAPFYEVLNSVALANNYPWAYPIFPGSPTVSPGNNVYLNMSYEQSNDTAYFYWENNSTGQVNSISWDIALGILETGEPLYDGSTADWVDEWSGRSGSMVNYFQNNWSDAQAQLGSNGAWQDLGATNPENDYIDTTHWVSTTSSFSIPNNATSFTDDWWACN